MTKLEPDQMFDAQMRNLRYAATIAEGRDRPDRDDIAESCRWAASRLKHYREQDVAPPMPANDIPQSCGQCECCDAWRTHAALQSPPPREADAALWPLVERLVRELDDYDLRDEIHGLEPSVADAFDALRAYRPPSAPAPAVTPACIGRDPLCPCQDGDSCHYVDTEDTKAWPIPENPS